MNNKEDINAPFIWMICLTAACGGLLFGYDWVVIGGAKPFYEVYFSITDPSLSGWVMGSALVGCIAGAVFAGVLSDSFGRKRPLILAALLFVISAAGTSIADSLNMFICFRIVGGVGIGLASTLSPMYIAEISPADRRGKMVAINQLTIVLGILAAQLVNLVIAEPVSTLASSTDILQSWNGQSGWRYMFGAELVPATIFLLLMFMVPESPRWLSKVNKTDKALEVLNKIGSTQYASRTLAEILSTLSSEDKKVQLSELRSNSVKPILIIGIVLATFQQWCGINVIFNYAQEIFASAGFDIDDTLKSIVATGLVNLIFTLVMLPLVDKVGRRKLMLFGSAGLAVVYGLIATAYAFGQLGLPVLLLVLSAIAIYAATLAPVTWVLLSEIFPNRVRGVAMALSTFTLWIASFVLTYTFPLLNHGLGASGSFLLYGAICVTGFWFIYSHVPETKGLSLEELESIFAENIIKKQTTPRYASDADVRL
jgi:sugar porter (SP) family MFS transporter